MITPAILFKLLDGPVFSIINKLVPDPDLKAKLKAEIKKQAHEERIKLLSGQHQIVAHEVTSGSRLTRSWRPILMYLIMFFLATFGLILPLIDWIAGGPVAFRPRWNEIPDGLWELLKLGVGGYIGGRSAEKIATTLSNRNIHGNAGKRGGIRRRNNLASR